MRVGGVGGCVRSLVACLDDQRHVGTPILNPRSGKQPVGTPVFEPRAR